jgi:hypothetical protein
MALARTQNLPPMTSTALTFAAHARLSDGRLREALELANEAERALSGADRAAFYQSWTTRAVQGLALFSLGRIGEAAQCFADNARRAREVGDDLAVVAGSSVIQFLPSDDVAAASALLERKEAMLAEAGTRGVMRETVALDRILLALYQNCGADLLRARGRGSAASAFFDDAALLACCALQGPHDATCRRTLRAALRAQPPSAVGLGVGAQLRATLRLMEGNALGAQAELALASEHYAAAEMALHAALMRWRAAALRADAAGEHKIEKLRSELVALGAARPERWLDALAPGLGPR